MDQMRGGLRGWAFSTLFTTFATLQHRHRLYKPPAITEQHATAKQTDMISAVYSRFSGELRGGSVRMKACCKQGVRNRQQQGVG